MNSDFEPFKFNYWSWFNAAVKQLKLTTNDAWSLDFVEIYNLFDLNDKQENDTSIMLNFERVQNGASKEWLTQNH